MLRIKLSSFHVAINFSILLPYPGGQLYVRCALDAGNPAANKIGKIPSLMELCSKHKQ